MVYTPPEEHFGIVPVEALMYGKMCIGKKLLMHENGNTLKGTGNPKKCMSQIKEH